MLRKILRSAMLLGSLFGPVAAHAACSGANLFDALPREVRAMMLERAHAVTHGQGLVWRATKGRQSILLIGTNHVPDSRHIALLQEVQAEFGRVKALYVEAGPDEEAALQKAMAERTDLMFMTDKTLPDILPEADWQALRKAGKDRGIPGPLLAKMQPAFVMITLAMPRCMIEALQAGQGGVDKRLIAEATRQHVPIVALEPYDTLFRVMDGLSQEDAIAMLQSTLAATEDGDATMATLADLYARGEVQLIWEFERQQALERGDPPAEVERQLALTHSLLIAGRNRTWVPEIEEAAAKGPIMVAAGALHMVGEDGVLALLERDGWKVSPQMRKLGF
ncbi:TraB/GumN family protein [Thioclava sp. GXIMD4216]|uniref:TraB/GumN family protein n=1 Tax=Thioclava sp. GXIMD4216 TaxID=3131929 RepID=UPI0030D1F23E